MVTNYEFANIGKLADLTKMQYILPDSKKVLDGKIFLNELINLSGSEISLNSFVPGQFLPFNHKHKKNEELFIILSGIGEFEIDGNKISIKEGSVIKVNPDAARNICNTSKDINLQFIVIQTVKDSMNSTKPTQDGIGVSERIEW
ncbi:cupin domain-containing protein [Sulfuricurvum sp.]|uniref:cupin domain-containing protein n=1 Tax=Sulfuricurvum sp. TaxID=2025608 RepID=UPI00260EA2F7|nr:cupin domain-containing protein [Sulfuricurvum sp.]MDD3597649.1 cupin domain-containing protein [Sulfuricurvum sp.]